MDKKIFDLYELIIDKDMPDLKSRGYLLKHKKSGARVMLVSNEDDNKVFSIGFRTTPSDDTGVPHILEHSVLCGSDKYMAKDPFVELCKGSLNTFLNAMTYPDKTVYPVASCNIVDFKNIMDVYLDAVFHPNIAKKDEIFRQEGWHYELESLDGPLTINGVVYNEMKGAFSSPEGVLERTIMNSLFPDNTYAKESGGDPACIPELTYEHFLEFYNKYYHPSNSYIYMYGDMDMEERLLYIDSEYLSKYDASFVDSAIEPQKPFDKTVTLTREYSVTESEANGNNDYLSYNTVVGRSTERELVKAFDVIDYVLLGAPGAPLKQALIEAGIGEDVYSSYESGIMQPMFSVIAKNTSADKKDEFIRIIKETLSDIVSKGIDKKALLAAINVFEFKYREADFGRYPRGLMYGLQAFDSWLYDENEPFMHIEANETYAFLRKMVDTDYYEKLISQYILDNNHSSVVILKAKVNLTALEDEALKEKLAAVKASKSQTQLEEIIKATRELKEYQDEPSTEEELMSIPMLKREDIRREAEGFSNIEKKVNDVTVIHHNYFTNGIAYVNLYFDTDSLPEEMIQYVGLLKGVLGYIDTENYSYRELSNEIDIATGGISFSELVVQNKNNRDDVKIKMAVRLSALYSNLPKAFEIINEILYNSKLNDYKRLKEIIAEGKARLASTFLQAGHNVAVLEASSSFSKLAYYNNLLSGYGFYQFIERIDNMFDVMKEEIAEKLTLAASLIFNKQNLIAGCTVDEEGYKAFEEAFLPMTEGLAFEEFKKFTRNFYPKQFKLGLTNSSKVQYVATAGNFLDAGYEYKGTLKMLSIILGYDYLWINVRVKGGAYGCMSSFNVNGNSYMVSYRDPKLSETLDVYRGVVDYLKNFDVSERDMTKFVIGTMGNIDTPLNARAKGARSMTAYFSNITVEDVQKERNEILNATKEDIAALAKIVEAVINQEHICVIGNEEKILANNQLFTKIKAMFAVK